MVFKYNFWKDSVNEIEVWNYIYIKLYNVFHEEHYEARNIILHILYGIILL
jgi:hypothetical protein